MLSMYVVGLEWSWESLSQSRILSDRTIIWSMLRNLNTNVYFISNYVQVKKSRKGKCLKF